MTNNSIHFEVVVEGVSYKYRNFNQARDFYNTLKESGFVEIFLCRKVDGEKTVYWNDRSCCFVG